MSLCPSCPKTTSSYSIQSLGLCTQDFPGVGKAIAVTQGSKSNRHSTTILQELALSKMA